MLPSGGFEAGEPHEPLPDGRSNIMLRGLRVYTIQEEVGRGTAYRQVRVTWNETAAQPLAPGVRETSSTWAGLPGKASGQHRTVWFPYFRTPGDGPRGGPRARVRLGAWLTRLT